jgi:glycosyltransferase involved in cell wall biosynthesis
MAILRTLPPMKRYAYLVYKEHYRAIIEHQAIDIVRFIDQARIANAMLVVFVDYAFRQRETDLYARAVASSIDSCLIPSLPHRIAKRALFLEAVRLGQIVKRHRLQIVHCRGHVATQVALIARRWFCHDLRVCYDGRSARAAELAEYGDRRAIAATWAMERAAVLESDYRTAVSSELVDHWKSQFGYTGDNHAVIPTTLDSTWPITAPPPAAVSSIREQLGFHRPDIVFVYSGSNAPWQGFDLLVQFVNTLAPRDTRFKFLLLTPTCEAVHGLRMKYPGQVQQLYVPPSDLPGLLRACDYGLLLRPDSVTNKVAAPTKFAEYLYAGLEVIVCGNPFAQNFVSQNACGYSLDAFLSVVPKPIPVATKSAIAELAALKLTKTAFKNEFVNVIA